MFDFHKPIPSYLYSKKNIVSLVLFTALFALVFINIYAPFGSDRWYDLTKFGFFFYSSLTIMTGVLVVVVSRVIMYKVCKRYVINIWQYVFWIFAEILLMALVYASFEKIVLDDARLFADLVKNSSRHTALVLLLPYSILWLWFSMRDKKEQILKMADDKVSLTSDRDMIPFYDDKGSLKFSIKKDNLLYIESAENYVRISYLSKDNKVTKYLLRDTLKRVEEKFFGTDIVRCHRSFIVNFDKVKVIRKDKDGLKLELEIPSAIDLPVSKTYVASVMQTFAKYCHSKEI